MTTVIDSLANSTNCIQVNDEDIDTAAFIIVRTVTALSALAIILTLFFIFLFKRWGFFNQRLVLYLSLTTMIFYITVTLSSLEEICKFAAFASQVGAWMNLNAYICITGTLFLKVFFTINLERWDIWTVLFIFASPFLFNWIPFIQNAYGNAGPVCWIKNVQEVNGTCKPFVFGEILQLVLWYIPLYVILTAMIIAYTVFLVKFCFHRKQFRKSTKDIDSERKRALRYIFSLLAYPVILFVVNIFSFINRLYELRHPESPSSVLMLLNSIFFSQQGLGIFIIFLVSIRKKLRIVHMKAALREWCNKSRIREYSFRDDKRELSFSSSYNNFKGKHKKDFP